jgi:hypothetical protein
MTVARDYIAPAALRLPDGEILQGDDHLKLAMKAINEGHDPKLLSSGHINRLGQFCPMYPTDMDLVPKINTELDARQLVRSRNFSIDNRDAADRLSKGNDLYEYMVKEFDSLLRPLPLVVCVKRLDNDTVFRSATNHGFVRRLHPELYSNDAEPTKGLMQTPASIGFIHDDGTYLSRKQAMDIQRVVSDLSFRGEELLGGEEWIPYPENEDEADSIGSKIHSSGYSMMCNRKNVLCGYSKRWMDKKLEHHKKMIFIMMKSYERELLKWQA